MDWADDVAYSVHDVEDGIHGGYIRLERLLDDADEQAALCADVAEAYSPESPSDLAEVLRRAAGRPGAGAAARLRRQPRAPRSALKRFTSVLTGRFVAAAVDATRERVRRRARCAATPPTWWCPARSGPSARCSRASRCGT